MRRFLLVALIIGMTAFVLIGTDYQIYSLSSGKQIKSLGIFKNTKAQFGTVFKYQTDLSLDDKLSLESEADEIMKTYQTEADNAGLRSMVISAYEKPQGSNGSSKSFNFYYKQSIAGNWIRVDSP